MDQRKIMMICLVGLAVMISGVLFSTMGNGQKNQTQDSQWKWDDSWNGNMPSNSSPKPSEPVKPEPKEKLSKPDSQIEAKSYAEALKKSEETGRPVLVIYTANWCGYCKKMKSETLSNDKVKEAMKSFIVVVVDTDKDRSGIGKFSVTGLPSYVITNSKEEKLKMGSGFMNAESFSKWLNDLNVLSMFYSI
jgi:thiol:disulfide interchange protein